MCIDFITSLKMADHIQMAKLSEQAERYEDMADSMKKLVNQDANLTVEGRNLLSVAYKNLLCCKIFCK